MANSELQLKNFLECQASFLDEESVRHNFISAFELKEDRDYEQYKTILKEVISGESHLMQE